MVSLKQIFGVENLLEGEGANADVIYNCLVNQMQKCGLDAEKTTSFVSDGASVMTGRSNGVAANLKGLNKTLLSFHCICHRLALACADANDDVSFIKDVEATLKHLWKFFDNSSEKTAAYIKIQESLRGISLSNKGRKAVARKMKKACRTRWLREDSQIDFVTRNVLWGRRAVVFCALLPYIL